MNVELRNQLKELLTNYWKDPNAGHEVLDVCEELGIELTPTPEQFEDIIMNVRLYGAKCSDKVKYEYQDIVINNIDYNSHINFTFY